MKKRAVLILLYLKFLAIKADFVDASVYNCFEKYESLPGFAQFNNYLNDRIVLDVYRKLPRKI